MIYFECFLTYFRKFPVNSDKKELRFGQNFNKLYCPKIQLDLTYIFSHRLFLYSHPKLFTKWHDYRLKQNITKKKKNLASQGAGTSPSDTPSVCQLISLYPNIMNEPLSLGLISSYIVLYQMILQKTCLKNERQSMRGEAFWGLKNPENPGASGGSAPWTHAGALPLDPTRGP